MNTDMFPTGSRSDDQEPVKARDTTTRRTRSTRRLVGLAVAGLALAVLRRRRRSKRPRRASTQSSASGDSTGRRGGGRGLGRRLAVTALSAVAVAAARRFVGQRSGRRR